MDKKKFAQKFERTLLLAKARAYSKLSLERPLTDKEFRIYKETMQQLI